MTSILLHLRLGVAVAACMLTGKPALAADAAHPEVVELFQSQGCSSCPPANANVLAISDRPEVLTLSWQVTYWDQLGWKDTFGSPAFTARQWDYAHAFHRAEVATPEVVVNGRADIVGSNRGDLNALLRRADRGDGGPKVEINGDHVTLTGVYPQRVGFPDVVLLVRYDPSIVQVAIQRGENGGQTLPHKNVVHEVLRLGDWRGGEQTYVLPVAGRGGLKTAILVETAPGGPILAAAHT